MNTRAFLATTAAAAFMFGAAATANAQTNITISGSYSATTVGTPLPGGTGTANVFYGSESIHEMGSGTDPVTTDNATFTQSLTAGTAGNTSWLFGLNPGSGDPNSHSTDTGNMNYNLTIWDGTTAASPSTNVGNINLTFTSSFDFNTSDDYMYWLSATSTDVITEVAGLGNTCGYTSCTAGAGQSATSGDYEEWAVSLTGALSGYTLDIYLSNDYDWDLGATITTELIAPTGGGTVPEPASIALFATGLVGLGAIRRRMTGKTRKAAA